MADADSVDSFFSSLKKTLQSWMNSDRVRIVGSQGRSLQIQPGQRLVIGHQCWIVQKRVAAEDPSDAERMRVTYELCRQVSADEKSPCDILEVIFRKDGSTAHQAALRQGTQEFSICEEDITILPHGKDQD